MTTLVSGNNRSLNSHEISELLLPARNSFQEAQVSSVDRSLIITPERDRLVKKFTALQFEAYKQRLQLQPGGKEILRSLQSNSSALSPELTQITNLIGAELLKNVSSLGQDVLKLYRAYGRTLETANELGQLIAPSENEFSSKFLSGLTDSRNNRHNLSYAANFALASSIHEAWRVAVARVKDPTQHQSKSAGNLVANSAELMRSISELAPILVNVDSLGSFSLCRQLAKLSDSEFQSLLDISVPGNPRGLDLKFYSEKQVLGRRPTDLCGVRSIQLDPVNSVNAHVDGLEAFSIERPYAAQAKLIGQLLKQSVQKEKEIERQDLLASIFNSQEVALGVSGVEKLMQGLAQLVDQRASYLEAYSEALHADSDNLSESQLMQSERAGLGLKGVKVSVQLVQAYLDRESAKLQEGRNQFVESLNPNMYSQLRLVSQKDFPFFRNEILAMISHAQALQQQEGRASTGGVVLNYYSDSFWGEFLQNNGALLVSLNRATLELNGFFAYYRPASIPANHKNVPERYHTDAETSYAELIVCKPKSAGTFFALMNAMVCDLIIEQARFSEGIVYDWNQRSISALQAAGHMAIQSDKHVFSQIIPADLREAENSKPQVLAAGIPMRMAILPSERCVLVPMARKYIARN